MKILLIFLISFNVIADARTDALNVRFDALTDIDLAMKLCGFNYTGGYAIRKVMLAASDNTMLGCLESKNLEVKTFIDTQNASDLAHETARANIQAKDCSLEIGFLNDVCVYLK